MQQSDHTERGEGVVVLINTGKAEALEELQRHVPGDQVHVITENAYAGMYPSSTSKHYVDDIGNVDAVLSQVLQIAAKHGVRAVVSPSERSMPAGGHVRSFLSLPGVPVDVANFCTNKVAMKRRLGEAAVPVAPFRAAIGQSQLRSAVADLGFPVIVKPALGTGSMNTFVIRSDEELNHLIDSEPGRRLVGPPLLLVVESFLSVQQEVTCDGVIVDGNVLFAIASRYNSPLFGGVGQMLGAATIADSDPLGADIRALHERVVNALGVRDAVTHMEALVTDDGLFLGEIACRPGGAGVVASARLATGVDLWDSFMRQSLGLPLDIKADGKKSAPLMWTTLPTVSGRVDYVSTAADFDEVEGIRLVDMHVKAGDTISARMHSSSTTGVVFLDVPDTTESTVRDGIARIRASYCLKMADAHDQGELA